MSDPKPVKLTKDGQERTVRDPSTVTALRTQGWKVEASKKSAPATSAPKKDGEAK